MEALRKFWDFLRRDTFSSWLVSLILIFIVIKFLIFPLLALVTGTSLPLVVVESCSMHHNGNFESWWSQNGLWYEKQGITKEEFSEYALKNGFTKGDIILVRGLKEANEGDVIIFVGGTQYPIIHRVISTNPISTKGDNNAEQLAIERSISYDQTLGKAVGKVPLLGWVKLLFFELFKTPEERGLC